MIKLNPPYIDVEETMPLVEKVLRSGILTQGPMVREFESLCEEMTGADFAIAVSNATVGLELVIASLNIKPGNEIITTPFTFKATINAILRSGAIPRYADITDDYTICPESVARLVNNNTKAIIPVHLYGYPANMDGLRDVVNSYNVIIISDASQAHGSRYRTYPIGDGVQSFASVFSFYATKNVGAGEGGVVTTSSSALADNLLHKRTHDRGRALQFNGGYPTNARMSELQAAVAIPQLKRLDEINARRRSNALTLQSYLGPHPHMQNADRWSNFHLYTIEHDDPQRLINSLKRENIEAKSYYRYIHDSYMINMTNAKDQFPKAYEKAKRVVSIPVHPGLSAEDIHWVGENVKRLV